MQPPFQILDLSEITAFLVGEIDNAVQHNVLPHPPTTHITVSGSSPDSVRQGGGCQLTFYLFHVDQDPHYRNTAVTGPRAVPIPYQPFALNLYYILTAYADANAVLEQQAMGIALKWLYDHPLIHDISGQKNEFTLTLQPESAEALGRLWQSIAVPARLSAVYRVAVVFLKAKTPEDLAKAVERVNLGGGPARLDAIDPGEVMGTERRVTYLIPGLTGERAFTRSPATVAPGQRFHVWGTALGVAPLDKLFLLDANGAETNVSAWIVANVDEDKDHHRGARLTVQLPNAVGVPPAGAPAAGIYQLRAGSDGPPLVRSNATPFSVAAAVDGPTVNPILTPVAGQFDVTGTGFDNALTDVLLGTVALTRRNPGDTLNDGDFVAGSATALSFRAPGALPTGNYPLRIRVNHVESDPSWWVAA